MASDEASRTGGTWSSVMMWLGMAGEFGIKTDSWTSRSKIWLPAGEASLGEEENPRLGEEGIAGKEASVWTGDAGDRACFASLVELVAVGVESEREMLLADSSAFFLPIPKRPRILFFYTGFLISFPVLKLQSQTCDLIDGWLMVPCRLFARRPAQTVLPTRGSAARPAHFEGIPHWP